MSTYIIGDVQGCYQSLQALLKRVQYRPAVDELWFVGDLVNRGPSSLETLQLISDQPHTRIVLGNHDLHLLAIAQGVRQLQPKDTLQAILDHDECEALLDWLRCQPLFYYDSDKQWVMTHAGLYPLWTLDEHQQYTQQVEQVLQAGDYGQHLQTLFGNEPYCWSEVESLQQCRRFTVNAMTRMRFCDQQACLNFQYNGRVGDQPDYLQPWFTLEPKYTTAVSIAFGHWAALEGYTHKPSYFALDTGCVWGQTLTAYCIETQRYYSVDNKET